MDLGESLESSVKGLDLPDNVVSAFNDYVATVDSAERSAEDFASKNSQAFESVSESASNLGQATKSAGTFSNVLKSIGGTLTNMAIGAAIGLTITGIIKGLDLLIETSSEAREAMDQALSGYSNSTTDLDNINSELQQTQQQIDSLQSKGKLTFVEQEQLETLKETTAELKEQQALAEINQKKSAEDALESISHAYDKEYGDYNISEEATKEYLDIAEHSGAGISSIALNDAEDISAMIASLEKLNELRSQAQNDNDQNSVEYYNDSIESFTDEIENQLTKLGEYKENLNNIPKEFWSEDDYELYDKISQELDYVWQTIDPTKWKELKFDEIFSDDAFSGLEDELIGVSQAAGDAGLSIEQLQQQYPDLADAVTNAGMSLDDFVGEINAQAAGTSSSANTIADSIELLETQFSSFQTSAVSAINSIDSINAALVNSVSGSGLAASIDEETGALTGDLVNIKSAYEDLDGYDASVLFEKTANGVRLNRDALRQLQAQEEALQKSNFISERTQLQEKLNKAIADQQAAQANGDSDAVSDNQQLIDLLNQQIEVVDELSAAYDGATSAYQKWIDAQSNGEEGDMYDMIASTALERGQDLFDKGLVGTNEFRAIADLFSSQDLATASLDEVVKAYENARPVVEAFFTEGQEGCVAFANKLVELGQATKDAEGNYIFDLIDTQALSEQLGLDVELVEAAFNKLKDYGFDIQFVDSSNIEESTSKLEELTAKAKEAQESLKAMSDSSTITSAIDFNIEDLNSLDELQGKINELNELKASPEIDDSEAQQLQTVIDACQSKIDALNSTSASPSITLDGVQDAYSTAGELVSRIQEIENINATSNLNIDVNGDDKIQSLAEQLSQLPSEVKTSIGIDESADAASIIQQIQNTPETIKIPIQYYSENNPSDATTDSTKTITVNEVQGTKIDVEDETKTVTVNEVQGTTINIENETQDSFVNYHISDQDPPKDQNADVNYQKGSQENPNDKTATVDYKRGKQDNPASPKTAKVNYELGTVAKPPSVTVKVNYDTSGKPNVNGTAHYLGTAPHIKGSSFADGNWGLTRHENALTGELGQELIVRNGKFFTVGDMGPEFVHLRPGDIVFNHLQTKMLLERGYVTSRGKMIGGSNAHVTGTAHATVIGGGRFNIGGSGSNASSNSSGSKNSNTAKSSQAAQSAAKATQQAAKSVQNAASAATSAIQHAADSVEEIVDWVEKYLDQATRTLDNLTSAADRLDGYITQNQYLDKAQKQVQESIKANTDAMNYYMQYAAGVSLSNGYKQKVMNGQINIETISDEDLRDKISEFEEWYQKAQDCADAIAELNAQYVELANQRLSNIQQDFESIIDVTDAIYENYSAGNAIREARGQSADISNLQIMIEQRNNAANWLRGEFSKMDQELTNLMNQGTIKKYSEDWYAWQAELHNISAALKENQADVIDLQQQIREVRWETFEDAVSKIDAANDELDHTLSLIDDLNSFVSDSGALNSNGIAKLGLLTRQLGNARELVADYEKAMQLLSTDLYNGNISQEQYNEELKEYKSAQQDAISSVKEYRDAIIDLVKDGINRETEAMQKLVDQRKADLQAQKDATDYAKSLRDQTSSINKIQAQIAALEGDDSASAQAQLRNLRNQLKEEQQNLQDLQDDHQFDVLQDGYESAMEKFEEIQDAEIDRLETSLDAQNEAIQSMLTTARDQYQVVYDELNEIAETYGFKLSSDLSDPWKNAQNAAEAYKAAVDKVVSDISVNTSKLPSLSTGSSDVTYAENVNTSTPTPTLPAAPSTAGMVSSIGATLQMGSRGDSVRSLQTALNQLGFNAGSVDGIFGNNTRAAVRRFQQANGIAVDGIVGKNTKAKFASHGYRFGGITDDEWALMDESGLGSEIFITPNGVLRQFEAGTHVFSPEQTEYLWNMTREAQANTLAKYDTPPALWNEDSANVGVNVETFLRIDNIEGDVSDSTIAKLQGMVENAIHEFDQVTRKQIKRDARKLGMKR